MRFLLCTLFVLQTVFGFSQENNPFNEKGKEYASSLALIQADFQSGKVKDITENTLAYYSRTVPSRNDITLEIASKVIETLKSPTFDFEAFLSSVEAPAFTRETYLNIFRQSFRLHGEAFSHLLRSEAEAVTNADIDKAEKESLLTLISMVYHTQSFRQGCAVTISSPNGSMTDDSGTGCVVMGIGVGYFVGNLICGLPCGIGGAIVGGIVGALT